MTSLFNNLGGKPKHYRHGHKPANGGSPEYIVWRNMIARCTNLENNRYALYGGRGIAVCQRWRDDFVNFLTDMGRRPKGLTLERIDNDGNYEPANCRWATRSEQARNRRSSRFLEHNGKRLTLAEWADFTGLDNRVIHNRLKNGWTIERALTTQVKRAA